MAYEIERKWLVSELPISVSQLEGTTISQGYLAIGNQEEVRVRITDLQCWLTVKQGSGLVRKEIEVTVSRQQANQLWPATLGRRLTKYRRRLLWSGKTLEVDSYGGALSGLLVAEVEFQFQDEAQHFSPPPWVGDEITGDDSYSNHSLAR